MAALWRSQSIKAELSVRVDGVLGVATTRAYGCDDKQHCLCSEKIYICEIITISSLRWFLELPQQALVVAF